MHDMFRTMFRHTHTPWYMYHMTTRKQQINIMNIDGPSYVAQLRPYQLCSLRTIRTKKLLMNAIKNVQPLASLRQDWKMRYKLIP
jgi:hypothetical protein